MVSQTGVQHNCSGIAALHEEHLPLAGVRTAAHQYPGSSYLLPGPTVYTFKQARHSTVPGQSFREVLDRHQADQGITKHNTQIGGMRMLYEDRDLQFKLLVNL